MKLKSICLFILFSINSAAAISLGVNVSDYGGPSFGIKVNSTNISTDLDLIFSFKKENIHAYNYDYTRLLEFDSKIVHIGIRLNSNYSITTKVGNILFGPLAGFDRYLFTSKVNMPSFSSEMTTFDSTINYNQFRAGLYFGGCVPLSGKLAVTVGTGFGYLFGENIDKEYMVKNRMYKFDILDNRIGLSYTF